MYKVKIDTSYTGAFQVKKGKKLIATFWASKDNESDAKYCARALNLRELTRDQK